MSTAEQIAPFKPDPVSEETFAALTYLFQDDHDLALDATSVGLTPFSKEFELLEQPEAEGPRVHHYREKIVFRGLLDTRVPGYFACPLGASEAVPCVLLIDGLGGSKDRWWAMHSWPRGPLAIRSLLNAGCAVLALDLQYHGERGIGIDYEPPGALVWGDHPRLMSFLRAVVESTVEHRRAIDYLETRSEIDSRRIGVLGHSLGGIMAFLLCGLEQRLGAAVSCVVPLTPRERICPFTPHHFAARNEHTPFLMLMGRDDKGKTEEEVQYLFDQIAAPQKRLAYFDSGHRLPPEYVAEATAWFIDHLV